MQRGNVYNYHGHERIDTKLSPKVEEFYCNLAWGDLLVVDENLNDEHSESLADSHCDDMTTCVCVKDYERYEMK